MGTRACGCPARRGPDPGACCTPRPRRAVPSPGWSSPGLGCRALPCGLQRCVKAGCQPSLAPAKAPPAMSWAGRAVTASARCGPRGSWASPLPWQVPHTVPVPRGDCHSAPRVPRRARPWMGGVRPWSVAPLTVAVNRPQRLEKDAARRTEATARTLYVPTGLLFPLVPHRVGAAPPGRGLWADAGHWSALSSASGARWGGP